MRRPSVLLLVGAFVAAGFVSAGLAFFALPSRLVDDARFPDAATNPATEELRLKARHDVRTAGVQLVGALALIVGGALTWRTVWLTREGQITDRLSRAIEQLGDVEKRSVRIGAIHALGRVARDSRGDHAAVIALLGEHLRTVSPAVGEDGRPLDLGERRGIDPEVRAVTAVLRARRARWDPREPRPNFSGIDFRNAPLQGVDLRRADLRGSNFRGAYLSDANLARARIEQATLQATSLQRADLRGARLAGADLRYAHAANARLRHADLDEVVWESTELLGANLRGATGLRQHAQDPKLIISSAATKWPRANERWWRRRS